MTSTPRYAARVPAEKTRNLPRTILLVLTIPVVAVATGFGHSYADVDLTGIAEDSGVALSAVEDDITGGQLTLAAAAFLASLCAMLILISLVTRPPSTGRRVAQVISLVMSLLLIAFAGWMAVGLYPEFQDMVRDGA